MGKIARACRILAPRNGKTRGNGSGRHRCTEFDAGQSGRCSSVNSITVPMFQTKLILATPSKLPISSPGFMCSVPSCPSRDCYTPGISSTVVINQCHSSPERSLQNIGRSTPVIWVGLQITVGITGSLCFALESNSEHWLQITRESRQMKNGSKTPDGGMEQECARAHSVHLLTV